MRVLFTVALVLLSAGTAWSQPPVPGGLVPGSRYHLIFNSSTFTSGLSAEIEYYNSFAQDVADVAGLGSSAGVGWSALLSTATDQARNNAVVGQETPVFNMNGELVATGFGDLWDGTLRAELAWDEYGRFNPVDAWTGSHVSGRLAAGLTLGNDFAWCGRPTFTDSLWINFTTPPTSALLHVYALSQELIVPVAGDYDGSGQVEQGDLDLVLLHWGRPSDSRPDGWIRHPADGLIDQNELDLVLLHWGQSLPMTAAEASISGVPEPPAMLLLVVAMLLAGRQFVRHPPGGPNRRF